MHPRFAGVAATRLASSSRAAASGADIALIARGGYGLTRILDAIPYKAVAKAIQRGTEFVGLSDFTALQNALLVKTGAVTWAGPAVGEDFGAEGRHGFPESFRLKAEATCELCVPEATDGTACVGGVSGALRM